MKMFKIISYRKIYFWKSHLLNLLYTISCIGWYYSMFCFQYSDEFTSLFRELSCENVHHHFVEIEKESIISNFYESNQWNLNKNNNWSETETGKLSFFCTG